MGWRMLGKPIETAEMSASPPTVAQKFTLSAAEPNQLLKSIAVGIIAHDPSFTALTLELWSDQGGSPSKLIATSTSSKVRSDLLPTADDYGVCFSGFEFAGVPLKSGASYWIALRATGYAYTSSSHLAWRLSYPDPQYRTGLTLNATKSPNHPFEFGLITADL